MSFHSSVSSLDFVCVCVCAVDLPNVESGITKSPTTTVLGLICDFKLSSMCFMEFAELPFHECTFTCNFLLAD